MIKEETKTKLIKIAADLQKKTGKRVDFDTAISFLIDQFLNQEQDWEKFEIFCIPFNKVTKEELLEGLYQGRKEDEKKNGRYCLLQ